MHRVFAVCICQNEPFHILQPISCSVFRLTLKKLLVCCAPTYPPKLALPNFFFLAHSGEFFFKSLQQTDLHALLSFYHKLYFQLQTFWNIISLWTAFWTIYCQQLKKNYIWFKKKKKNDLPRQAHDVNTTSPQRRCNVMTLHRHWGDVVFTSCARWDLPTYSEIDWWEHSKQRIF